MTQLQRILTAILALFGRLFILPTPTARRGSFNLLPVLAIVFLVSVMTACGSDNENSFEYNKYLCQKKATSKHDKDKYVVSKYESCMNDLERKEQNAQRELNNKRFNALVIFVVIGGIIALIWKLTGNATGKTASNSTNIVKATNANTPAKNLYAKGSNGWTPLHDAARSGQTETEIALIKDKARSGQGHKSNIIYLYRAIEDGQVEITTALIKVGTPVNAKDNNGWTPLHFAAYHSQTEIALALIKAGARLDMHTDNNKTPLDIAVEKHGKDSDIVRLLLKHEGKE